MMQRCFETVRRGLWMVVVTAVAMSACRLEAAVTWHENLAAAKSASLASHRPVLVIFTAAWSQASDRFVQKTLAAPEVTAVVSSCFEPVRLDVDANGELAKQFGVSHLPTACIVDQNDAVLARFDCPEASAEFVSNAARAIHAASQARGGPAASTTATSPTATSPTTSTSVAAAVRPSATEPTVAPPLPATPPAWPAKSVSQPLDQSPAPSAPASDRLSAFSSASPQQAAAAPTLPQQPVAPSPQAAAATQRQVIEPTTAAPWASPQPSLPQTQPAATPSTPGTGLFAGQSPAAYPSTTSATPSYPTTAAAAPGYPAYPSTAATPPSFQGSTPALPIYSGSAAAALASPTVPPASSSATSAPPTSAEEKKSSNAFVAFFQDPMSAFKKSAKTDAAGAIAKPSASATPQPPTPRNPSVASQSPASAVPATTDAYGSMPVGLEGYCAVTLVEKSVWVEGRPQWGVRHRGRTYLFAGPAEQQAFLAAPDRYAPALSGDDPVLAFDAGRQVPGQRRYGVTYQSRIYLFSSPESRTAFSLAPDKYVNRVFVAESPQTAAGTFVR